MRFSTVAILSAVVAAASAAQLTVVIKNLSFVPATLNVQPGDSVTWTNNDTVTHTVTSGAGASSGGGYGSGYASTDAATFDSGNVAPGQTFSYTFAAAGTTAYHCNIHSTMKATVISGTPNTTPSSGNALSAPAKVIMAVGAGAVAFTQLL
ncbi:hypothetical protein BGZ98_002657 [Dissophora globulifera]|nr:hypothetical protein BGZ98_002657 [Dissophora globulifera]